MASVCTLLKVFAAAHQSDVPHGDAREITMRSLFERKGRTFVPTDLSRGPRGPYVLHRGPATALLARAVESTDGAEETCVTSVAIQVLRPVPLEGLETSARLVRRGRPVEIVEAILSRGTSPVARMVAVRVRHGDLAPTPGTIGDLRDLRTVASAAQAANAEVSLDPRDGFHSSAVERRCVRVLCDEPGRFAEWMRLTVPLLPDEPTSALCRVCAVADVGLGLSSRPRRGRSSSEPELTVRLERHPLGEWVCVEQARGEDAGVEGGVTRLFDRQGAIGRAHGSPAAQVSRRSPSRASSISRLEPSERDIDDLEGPSVLFY